MLSQIADYMNFEEPPDGSVPRLLRSKFAVRFLLAGLILFGVTRYTMRPTAQLPTIDEEGAVRSPAGGGEHGTLTQTAPHVVHRLQHSPEHHLVFRVGTENFRFPDRIPPDDTEGVRCVQRVTGQQDGSIVIHGEFFMFKGKVRVEAAEIARIEQILSELPPDQRSVQIDVTYTLLDINMTRTDPITFERMQSTANATQR